MQQQQHQQDASALSNKAGRKKVFLVFIWGRTLAQLNSNGPWETIFILWQYLIFHYFQLQTRLT